MISHSGQYEPLGTARLPRGRHTVEIEYDTGALPAGSGGPPFPMGPLFFAPVTQQPVQLLAPQRATDYLFAQELSAEGADAEDMGDIVGVPALGQHRD